MQESCENIMLMANIIYLPGSGGSFLRRALTLSDRAVMADPQHKITALEKFSCYSNWNHAEWKQAEKMHRPAYRTGQQEFWLFEQSDMYVIDAWHPAEFDEHDRKGTAWNPGAWPWLVVITVGEQHRLFLHQNQATKCYTLDWNKEHTHLQNLIARYESRMINLDFDDLLDRSRFLLAVERIDRCLHLDLVMPLVDQLWATWYQESMAVWHQ